jgi:hypothetical protein
MPGPIDRNGTAVTVGSSVRVVGLSASFLESLPDEEVEDVRSMIGQVYQVYEIDEHGNPWVEKVALDPSEMEIVEEPGRTLRHSPPE